MKSGCIPIFCLIALLTGGCDNKSNLSDGSGRERPNKVEEASTTHPQGDARPRRPAVAELRAEIDKMQATQFETIWAKVLEFDGDPVHKQFLLEKCLLKECEIGNPLEAFDILMKTIGPGNRRNSLIVSIIANAHLPIDELCRMQGRATDQKERQAFNLGISSVIANYKDLSILSVDCLTKMDGDGFRILMNGLCLRSKAVSREDPSFGKNLNEIIQFGESSASRIGNEFYRELIKTLARDYPFEVWEQLVKRNKIDGNTGLTNDLIAAMAQRDPRKALNAACSISEVQGAGAAFSSWLKLDPSEACQWYADNRGVLSPEICDQFHVSQAELAAKSGKIADARSILEEIADVKLRTKVESKVWIAERDVLRSEVGRDPAGTLGAIVSGQSKYGDYWLEEAKGTWVAKDFDKAQNWYQQNWNTMSAAKSQYVAAAFANQAVAQGDLATARQWAAYIQDTKTKQRIEASIAKAEGQKEN